MLVPLVMEHSSHNVVHVMMVTFSKELLVFQDVSKEATYSTPNALPVYPIVRVVSMESVVLFVQELYS